MIARWRLCAAVAGVMGAVTVPTTLPAGADTELPASFAVSAAADAVRVSTLIPGGVFSDGLVDFSSGSAGASIDSIGVSRAFAASPYPGPAGTNLFDLLRGQTGAPLHSYPLVAASDYPTAPEGSVSQPGLDLQARSGPGASEGTIGTGADGGQAGRVLRSAGRARAWIDHQSGSLVAESTMELSGIVAGPIVISKIASRARVVWPFGGEPQRERALELTGVTVGGQSVAIGPGGLLAPGGGVPLPDAAPAWQALHQAGITVRYAEAADTPTGVVSGALLITQVVPTSPTGAPSTITYSIGRARASVVVGAAPLAGPPGPNPSSASGSSSETGPPVPISDAVETAVSSVPAPANGTAPVASELDFLAPPGRTTVSSAVDSATPQMTAVAPAPGSVRDEMKAPVHLVAPTTTVHDSGTWSTNALYGGLLLSGGALLGGFGVLRRLGVRSIWGS